MTSQTTPDAMTAALHMMMPEHLTCAVVAVSETLTIFDAENQLVQTAVPKRQNEFRAGRAAAHRALKSLGIPQQPILKAPDRSPVWPHGIIGSITHTAGIAAAMTGSTKHVAGIGLDIDGANPLKPDLYDYILTSQEQENRTATPTLSGTPRCKITFVAKEALFKAIYPITRKFFGFMDAQLDLTEDGYWTAVVPETATKLPPLFSIQQGRWAQVDDLIVATVCVTYKAV
jgi:4'-phosphopantetheinyl transferase EntD